MLGIFFKIISLSSVTPILSATVSPGKEAKNSFKSIKRAAYRLAFNLRGFSYSGVLYAFVLKVNSQGKIPR